jgi:hypothetical protein
MPADVMRANADPASNFFMISSQKTNFGALFAHLANCILQVMSATLRDSSRASIN